MYILQFYNFFSEIFVPSPKKICSRFFFHFALFKIYRLFCYLVFKNFKISYVLKFTKRFSLFDNNRIFSKYIKCTCHNLSLINVLKHISYCLLRTLCIHSNFWNFFNLKTFIENENFYFKYTWSTFQTYSDRIFFLFVLKRNRNFYFLVCAD